MNDSKSVTGGSCVSYAALLILFVIIGHKFVYKCFYLSGFVFFCLDLFFGTVFLIFDQVHVLLMAVYVALARRSAAAVL